MKDFEDLKSDWDSQINVKAPNNGSEKVIKKVLFVKRKQLITNIVLGVTVVILLIFFFYIKAYNNTTAASALFLMITPLLVRVFMEFSSRKKLESINITANASTFKKSMIDYYKKRIKTHYVFTPIIAVLYLAGFIMLLPFFKEELSVGFYTYIKISGIIIFIVLAVFIRKEILKELKILKELCN